MATPRNFDEAKAMLRTEWTRFASSVSAIAGSRWLMAILATFALVFGSHMIYAPQRLPNVQGLSLAQAGLPPNVDFGEVGRQVNDLARQRRSEAAEARGELVAEIDARAAEDPSFIPMLNGIGFGATLVLLLGNIALMTARRRVSRG